ncbi:MAG TPA: uroporphyrinogen-III synthase [Puia sp.]|nr:uroporphyrinogen-III synthase [Puia sp.]
MADSIAYVLSTRPLSPTLIAEAAAKGITIDVVPAIVTAKLQDEKLSQQLVELSHRSLTAVFTSVNAVTAIENADTAIENAARWKIFCLSGATRRAVEERFGAIAGMADSAAQLAELMITTGPPGECWFFCGDKHRSELPDRLKAAGWQVHEVVVYQTILTPHRMSKRYDAVVFFSPSAVESFFSMNTIEPHVTVYAIGRTTAAAICAKCPNRVVTSELPDEQILIRTIISHHDYTKE